LGQKVMPSVAAAESHVEILGSEAQSSQAIDEESDELCVCGGVGLTEEIGVELKVFAQPALLLAFVPEELGDAEPFDWLLVVACVRGDEAREGGGHLGPKRHISPAFVGEMVELANDFFTALGGEELKWFEWGAIVFLEAVLVGDAAPRLEQVLPGTGAPRLRRRHGRRAEITKAGETIHGSAWANGDG
jgi:hypothetical protein